MKGNGLNLYIKTKIILTGVLITSLELTLKIF